MKKIIVIATTINNQRHFIATGDVSCESGGSRAVMYTPIPEQAKEFKAEGLAMDFIPKIKNPYNRSFKVCTVQIDQEKRNQLLAKLTAEEALV